MSTLPPFDIIAQIKEISSWVFIFSNEWVVVENKDSTWNLLEELALVSQFFLQICSKHLFVTVELHDAMHHVASSKKGFVNLFKSRPDICQVYPETLVQYRKYNLTHLFKFGLTMIIICPVLSPILPNFLRTIPRLNCFTITASMLDWNTLDSYLTSVPFSIAVTTFLPSGILAKNNASAI
jgi:hypothetical protein